MITYNTFKYAGKFDKKITLFTGAGGKEETVIQLKGFVDPMPMGVLEMTPRKTDAGELAVGKDNPISIIIANTGDAELTVTRIVSKKFDKVYFDGQASGNIVIPSGRQHKVSFAIRPEEPGPLLDTIMIYSDARNDIGNGYKGLLSGTVK